jgi:hypothetical protein
MIDIDRRLYNHFLSTLRIHTRKWDQDYTNHPEDDIATGACIALQTLAKALGIEVLGLHRPWKIAASPLLEDWQCDKREADNG